MPAFIAGALHRALFFTPICRSCYGQKKPSGCILYAGSVPVHEEGLQDTLGIVAHPVARCNLLHQGMLLWCPVSAMSSDKLVTDFTSNHKHTISIS